MIMRRRAFTLIELLVVVAIIAVLMAILMPSLKMARVQARDVVCRSNIGQVTRGFLYYATDFKNFLPGSVADRYFDGRGWVQLDWLGIGRTGNVERAPQEGTIFKYLNDAKVYRCPTHLLAKEADRPLPVSLEERTSYTAPLILTGASIEWLLRVRYPDPAPSYVREIPTREISIHNMMPAILIEEDANWYLNGSRDSAWVNEDRFTDRHRGAGGIGFVDGHAELRKLPKKPYPLTSWHLLYELTDGRVISAGHGGLGVTFGWLRWARTDR
jgi:prepilin-type N-terminal cleavage/methylation domain-containing protein/prepilin-type processing-associated H-X9-DG protein